LSSSFKNLPLPGAAGRPSDWGQLYGSAPALAIAEAAARHTGPVLVLAGSPRQADQLAAEIGFFGGAGLEVLLLPDAETLPWDAFSPHPDITSRRLATLARLPALARGVVVAATQTLLQRLPPPAWTATQGLDIALGDRLDPRRLRGQLQDAGYLAVPQVTEHGEFALRGSLLDLYPMGSELPYRIDLFDDVVDSIRRFDPGTQRSLDQLERIRLLPGREYPFSEDALRGFQGAIPRALSRRSVAGGHLPRRRRGHCVRGAGVLPAAVLRKPGGPGRLPAGGHAGRRGRARDDRAGTGLGGRAGAPLAAGA
jgi:transcription-repair coupling factor (superfamily II helicase)